MADRRSRTKWSLNYDRSLNYADEPDGPQRGAFFSRLHTPGAFRYGAATIPATLLPQEVRPVNDDLAWELGFQWTEQMAWMDTWWVYETYHRIFDVVNIPRISDLANVSRCPPGCQLVGFSLVDAMFLRDHCQGMRNPSQIYRVVYRYVGRDGRDRETPRSRVHPMTVRAGVLGWDALSVAQNTVDHGYYPTARGSERRECVHCGGSIEWPETRGSDSLAAAGCLAGRKRGLLATYTPQVCPLRPGNCEYFNLQYPD
jgi:hypothetical protein